MFDLPAETIEKARELAPAAFYALMGIALFTALLGAVGVALFFLVLGGAVHVARVGLEAL
jgi:hypothetical protein